MQERDSGQIRLQKFLAMCGVASRRKAEELIESGRVSVNGVTVTTQGVKVAVLDMVCVDGAQVLPEERKVYYAFNKPPFVMCTMSDPEGRQCVAQYFADCPYRLFPVGRLDYESEGLLLMTNDGQWAQNITHPKFNIFKEYLITVEGHVSAAEVIKLRSGVRLEDGMTSPALVSGVKYTQSGNITQLNIAIHEGRNRQIRRMIEAVSHKVLYLKRIGEGGVMLGALKSGTYRELTAEEIASVVKAGHDA